MIFYYCVCDDVMILSVTFWLERWRERERERDGNLYIILKKSIHIIT